MTAAPVRAALPRPSDRLRTPSALLGAGVAVSLAFLALSLVGLVVDPRVIEEAPAWLKPAKFGVSIVLYLVTIRWMIQVVRGPRRLLTAAAAVMLAGLTLELIGISMQVLRGTTSHFNQATVFDAAVYFAMGGVISTVFLATVAVAVLVLRSPVASRPIRVGVAWGLALSMVGMAEAILMTVNFGWSDGGGHTVGGVDGGPGMPITGWSTQHGDLRVGHFVGLHALQLLPILAFLLTRVPGLDDRTRARLVTIAGAGYAGLIALVTGQALRGQPLLAPDAATLAAGVALVLGVLVATGLVLRRARA
jgi:hypothetical protein